MKVKDAMMGTPSTASSIRTLDPRRNSCGPGTADFFPSWEQTERSLASHRSGHLHRSRNAQSFSRGRHGSRNDVGQAVRMFAR